MTFNKRFHVRSGGGFRNRIRHVNREKIRRRNKTINRFEADVVGVHMVRFFPVERLHRVVRFRAQARRLRADEGVFAIGLVPDGNEFCAEFRGEHARAQLGFALMRETVAHAKREFTEGEVLVHKIIGGGNNTKPSVRYAIR